MISFSVNGMLVAFPCFVPEQNAAIMISAVSLQSIGS